MILKPDNDLEYPPHFYTRVTSSRLISFIFDYTFFTLLTRILTPSSVEMNFVVTTGPVEKHDAEVRKMIRTHVMIGKNKGRVLPPRKKKKKNVTSATESSPMYPATIPRKFGSDLSATQFAERVTPEAVNTILHCTFPSSTLYK